MSQPLRVPLTRPAAVLLALAAALGVGLSTWGHILPLLLGAVTLATWYGGFRLGLGLLLLIVGVAALGLREHPNDLMINVGNLLDFLVISLLITGLAEAFRGARRRSEAQARARQQSEERYSLAVRGARDGIWDWNLRDGRVYCSRQMEELLGPCGTTIEEVMDGLKARLDPADRERVMAALRDHLERRFPFDVECRIETPPGEVRWFHLRGQATWDEDGRATRMAGSIGDINSRKQAEQELRDAKDAAESAGRSKDLFLAMLSHELRTPLTPALLGLTGVLEDPETPPGLRAILEAARKGVELEARLVDDLLDVTRISAGKFQLRRERVDVHAAILQAVDACRVDVEHSGVELELDLKAVYHHVDADPARLQQILWNLIKNGAKFTPPGGTVTVRTETPARQGTRDDDRALLIEVADTGVGIEPDLLPRIFDAFAQGKEGADRRRRGLGLGLAISRSLAEAHGGDLTVQSGGAGKGATFTLRLATCSRAQRSDPALAADSPTTPRQSFHILLVEDDQNTSQILSRLLQRSGSRVSVASTIGAAKEAVLADAFDLLISDLGLPDGSGLDLMRFVRAHRPIPGIALTGYGMDDDVRLTQQAGFIAHLTKPVDFRDLEAIIARVAGPQSDK